MIPLLFLLLAGAVREEQTLQIDGVRETWRLQWKSTPQPGCSKFKSEETGTLYLIRLRAGREYDRLEIPSVNVPVAGRIMDFGDYDHDSRATEFYLQTDSGDCGPVNEGVVVGISSANPKLHAFSPVLMRHVWQALRDDRSSTVRTIAWGCGDHGSEEQLELTLKPAPSHIDVTPEEHRCPTQLAPEVAVILDMMTNLHENGFNPVVGGLWINWRYGTSPIQANFKGSGETDGPADKPRHDILTDQRYLHNLLLYKHLHPADTRFDGDLDRFRKIIRTEFANSHNERGWLYDEFIDMYRLSGDDFYRTVARSLVESYAQGVSKGTAPVNFKRNASHPGGYYRVDNMLQQGAALIQAAHEFSKPEWEATGRRMLDFIYDHAYFKPFHCFAITMDNLFTPDGKLNPDETIYRDSTGRYTVDGGVVRLGGLGQIASSLLHAYLATKDKLFLDRATDLMDALSPKPNTLGLWDTRNLGYFNAIVFPGKSQSDPGKPKLSATKKESGRQAHMLEAAVLANRLTGDRYRKLEDDLVVVTTTKAYYAAGHGVPYEQAADWSLLPLKKGGKEDWVTSEAMGISLMALQQRERTDAW